VGAVAPAAKAAAIDTMAKAAASGAIPTEVVGWVLTASLLTFRQKSWKAVISVEPVFTVNNDDADARTAQCDGSGLRHCLDALYESHIFDAHGFTCDRATSGKICALHRETQPKLLAGRVQLTASKVSKIDRNGLIS
jgi:hypothetical protein